MKKTLLFVGGFLLTAHSIGQCTITGLNPSYCDNEMGDTLVPTGGIGSGTFSGPGVTGNYFDPSMAGPGNHQIDYLEYDPTSYAIDQTGTYAPVAGTGTGVSLGDDQVSGALPLGFTFNFFGVDYTTFYISSNGFITFNNDLNSGCCSGQNIPSASTPNNLIAFSWDDMYPPGNGSIQYFTTGTSPNQTCVVNFYDIPFCCGTTPQVKTQVIMYESTNIIEIHTEYANGVSPGTMGIENVDGTIAYAVPGRNSAAWPALANDYVAFIPAVCVTSTTVDVFASPAVTGTVDINPACVGDMVVFSGSGADSYSWDNGVTDGVPFTATTSGTFTVTGTEAVNGCSSMNVVNLVVNPNPTISLSSSDELFGNDGGIALTITGGVAPFTFDWNHDGTGDNDDNNDLYGVTAGTYTVTMTDGNGCMVTDSATVGSQVGLIENADIEFSIYPNPSTGVFQVTLATEQLDNLYIEVVNALGQQIMKKVITSNVIDVDVSGNESGTYYVRIISEDGISVKPFVLK